MFRAAHLTSALFLSGILLAAQTAVPSVQAVGTATISVQPDQAQLTVSVSTEGATADAAGQQNANVSYTLMTALNGVIGSNGTIQTQGYSVYPRYSSGAGPSTIVGYTATNTLQVTLNNLTLIGKVIDTANASGATSIGGLSLTLQNPDPVLQQALAAAAKQAQAHAGSIAAGLGGKAGPVISASQNSTYTPIIVGIAAGGAAASTTVQTGTVSVSATVTATFQLQ